MAITAESMRSHDPLGQRVENELDLLARLPLPGARALELGCGAAQMTREIAARFAVREIVATEVDEVQHRRNLAAAPVPRVTFRRGGAQRVDAEDASFDLVLMFKSLHHVPLELMDAALAEVARVLVPGGHAWISEPVFAGAFNDVIRLFHDEQAVRAAAFEALRRAVRAGLLEPVEQIFFLSHSSFADFAEFEQRIINVSHTSHRLDAGLHARVREAFELHLRPDGAHFDSPMRVDLLRRPAR